MSRDISRRTFVAGAAAAGMTMAVAGGLGSIASASASETKNAGMTPGTYTGKAQGHRGTMVVDVTVSENAIEKVEFVENTARVNTVIPDLSVDPFAIYAVDMLTDTPQILQSVVDVLPDRIVAAQSIDVDVVCGATMSSLGILNAVADALTQTGGDPSVFDVVPPAAPGPDETYDGFDLIVVGGGTSGTLAASSATAAGARVLLIEKSGRIGGCGSLSSGVHCTGSQAQIAAGFVSDAQAQIAAAAVGSGSAATSVSAAASGSAAAASVSAAASGSVASASAASAAASASASASSSAAASDFSSGSADNPTVSGGGSIDVVAYFKDAMKQGLWYPKAPVLQMFLQGEGKVCDFMAEVGGFEWGASADGCGYLHDSIAYPNVHDSYQQLADTVDTVLMETTVTSLVKGDDGSICGVTALKYDGTKVSATAKAVIIATGGFIGNTQMNEQYNVSYHSNFGLQQNVGECLNMMFDAGAKPFHIGGANTHIIEPAGEIEGFDDQTAMIPYTLLAAPSMLKVNGRGERFAAEDSISTAGMVAWGNYCFAQGQYIYTIVSKDQMDALASGGVAATGCTTPLFAVNFDFYPDAIDYAMADIEAALDAGVDTGFVFKGDTLEEFAEAAGFKTENFTKHVARYDAACAAGFDELYYKDAAYLCALGENGPYYAIRNAALPYCTMGGVEVDESMRVLDADGDPIPGLYAAGCETIGALYGGAAYSDCGGFPLGWATFSGYTTGASAAAAVLA